MNSINITDEELKVWKFFFFIKESDIDTAMHCKTSEEAAKFCEIMKRCGMTWKSGRPYDETDYECYTKHTCFVFNGGTLSDYPFMEMLGNEVLEFSEIDERIKEIVKYVKENDDATFLNEKLNILEMFCDEQYEKAKIEQDKDYEYDIYWRGMCCAYTAVIEKICELKI